MRRIRGVLGVLAAVAVAACGQEIPGPAGPPGLQGPPGPRGEAADLAGKVVQLAGAQPITYTLVAAGRLEHGIIREQFNGLRSVAIQNGGRRVLLTFDGARNPTADHRAIVMTQPIGSTAPLLGTCANALDWPFTAHASIVGAEGFEISMTDKTGRRVSLDCADVWLEVIDFSKTS